MAVHQCCVWLSAEIRTQHGTFPSFLETDKTAGAYSLQIYDNLSQIQRETKAFLLLVRHNPSFHNTGFIDNGFLVKMQYIRIIKYVELSLNYTVDIHIYVRYLKQINFCKHIFISQCFIIIFIILKYFYAVSWSFAKLKSQVEQVL